MEKIKFLDLRLINKSLLNKTKNKLIKQIYSGNYILDKNVEIFEKKFAKFNDANFCYGVNSGHDALKIALKALGVKYGDHILVPGMTFISTYFAVSELGGKPIPVDVGLDGVINFKKLPNNLSKNVKGLIAVNLYGNLCDFEKLKKYTRRKKIFLLEDSSQSHGAYFKKRHKTKMWGDAATFSFYPGKNLGSITDGGAIITKKSDIAKKIQLMRNYGSNKKYYHKIIGCNSRLNSTSSIFLKYKLNRIKKINNVRRKQELYYRKKIKIIKSISFLERKKNITASHHIFIIFVKKRNKLMNYLKKNYIETLIHYPVAPFMQKAYNFEYNTKDFPISIKFQNESLSLPLGEHIDQKKQDYIIKKIINFYRSSWY